MSVTCFAFPTHPSPFLRARVPRTCVWNRPKLGPLTCRATCIASPAVASSRLLSPPPPAARLARNSGLTLHHGDRRVSAPLFRRRRRRDKNHRRRRGGASAHISILDLVVEWSSWLKSGSRSESSLSESSEFLSELGCTRMGVRFRVLRSRPSPTGLETEAPR